MELINKFSKAQLGVSNFSCRIGDCPLLDLEITLHVNERIQSY